MAYWLVKSEPSVYSFEKLVEDKQTSWTGVRNYAARIHLRAMVKGDEVLYYHSNEGLAIVGIAKVIKPAYPDPTADGGEWVTVDLKASKKLKHPVPLTIIKANAALKQMALVRIGRLSVSPVTDDEFKEILRLSEQSSRKMKKLVVLTGAGISAESGLKTFRDSDGLWEGFDVEEVASIGGWHRNPSLVLDFYNARRKAVINAQPNAAHIGLASLQTDFDVTIITQNIDDLHERGGSGKVVHLHGEILKMRSVRNPEVRFGITGEIKLGDLASDGGQLRPDIVWFGEEVPLLYEAATIVSMADIFVIVGTSLVVYPAAGLIQYAPAASHKFILDRSIPPLLSETAFTQIEQPASKGINELVSLIKALA